MDVNILLEIGISLVFIYALLSIIVSSICEFILHLLNFRGKFLLQSLDEVFNDKAYKVNFVDRLYSHPGIDRLKKTPRRLPAYISSRAFAATLIDTVSGQYENNSLKFVQDPLTRAITPENSASSEPAYEKFRKAVLAMPYSDVKVLLRTLSNGAENMADLQKNVESWYDDYMDRVGGWYKNRLQGFLFFIAVVVTFAVNVDTIKMVRFISSNHLVREQLVKGAEVWAEQRMQDSLKDTRNLQQILGEINAANSQLNSYNLPIGIDEYESGCMLLLDPQHSLWCGDPCPPVNGKMPASALGLLVTALAISFGAPFWFQTLTRLINIRRTGKKPKTVDRLANL
jgi:hypothetical protein